MSKFLKILCFILIFFCFHLGAFGQVIVKNDFKVNDDATLAPQIDPAIAIDSTGNFVVVWTDSSNGNYDIYGRRFSSIGTPLASSFKVNGDAGSSSQISPDVARNPAGSFVVVWQDNRSGNYDIYGQRYNAAGTAQGGNLIIENGSANQTSPSVAMDSLGNFVVVWQDSVNGNWDIFGLRFNSSGAPLGTKFKVNESTGTDSMQATPAVGMDGNGNFVVTWCDLRGYASYLEDIYFQRFASNGNTIGTNIIVNEDKAKRAQYEPAIFVNSSGDFVITWHDYRDASPDIYAQRYALAGEDLVIKGGNFKVDDQSSQIPYAYPAVTLTSSGDFVITWTYTSDIIAQKYNSSGEPVDGNFLVNNSSTKTQKCSGVASTGTYTYFVWQDDRNDNFDIYAKVVTWAWSEVPEDREDGVSGEFTLSQNYPNPFNPQTSISFYLKQSGKVSIKVYNILGQRVRDLVDNYYQNGEHRVDWDGKDDSGKDVSAGVYFYQIKTETYTQAKKMVLLK
ncbi:MAG: T9SS type A sorting domain-containing protein [candidate division Zixibacteria bacterium]|nr:T9SS type A sorting domain-containing protein [candidate division Zixibacteria bacterium]